MKKSEFNELWEAYRKLEQKALTMNHYELAYECATVCDDPQMWKEFLTDQTVSDFIKSELNILQSTELAKLLKDISNSKSVGQAQLVNALQKIKEEKTIKTGPIFIYTYVPLSSEQKECPNTLALDKDPFIKKEEKK